MNRPTEAGNKSWYVFLSLAATIITIVVFLTGKNLPDFFTANTEVSTATKQPPKVIFLLPECGDKYYVNSRTQIELQYGGWAAKSLDILEDNLTHISINIKIDGMQVYGDRSKERLPISSLTCRSDLTEGFWTYYSVTLDGFSVGSHIVEVTYAFDTTISDGYDLNKDGFVDINSDPIIYRKYTIVSK